MGLIFIADTVCDDEGRIRMTRITDIVWLDMMIGGEPMVITSLIVSIVTGLLFVFIHSNNYFFVAQWWRHSCFCSSNTVIVCSIVRILLFLLQCMLVRYHGNMMFVSRVT